MKLTSQATPGSEAYKANREGHLEALMVVVCVFEVHRRLIGRELLGAK
ncbi:hypothetical protein [uncultured Aliiroseovarius sp.]|nr:hypothetical protein [uncultured Aliiroseovarius sp.]